MNRQVGVFLGLKKRRWFDRLQFDGVTITVAILAVAIVGLLVGAIAGIVVNRSRVAEIVRLGGGEVTAKRFEPARDYIQLIPVTQRVGNTTIVNQIPVPMHDDEDYILTVSAWSDRKEKQVTATIYVDAATYHRHGVGDFYSTDDALFDLEDEDVKKHGSLAEYKGHRDAEQFGLIE